MFTKKQDTTPESRLPSLVTKGGEINPAAYEKGEDRLKALKELFPPEKFSLVLFTQFMMAKIPSGATFYPQFVECTHKDLWDENNTTRVVKPGHVMLTAEFVIRIGLAAGIQLVKTSEGVVDVNGIPHWRAMYKATILLPDGSTLDGPETGKAQPLQTNDGKPQAHIIESTDKKAKRNAIKELLTIPTQMPRADAEKMWVVVKTIHEAGSAGARAIEDLASTAALRLYASTDSRSDAPGETGSTLFRGFVQDLSLATSDEDLNIIYDQVKKSSLGDIEKRALHSHFMENRTRLKQRKEARA